MAMIMVGLGGFLGACGRYSLTKLLDHFAPSFPFGTLFSNILAALLVGFLLGIERQSFSLSPHAKLFLTTGLLGGLSTFSTFSIETVRYFEDGKTLLAAGNVLLNVGLSLLCVLAGLAVAKTLFKTA